MHGIGDKTAVKLIQQFGGIEQIYEHIDEVTRVELELSVEKNRHNNAHAQVAEATVFTLTSAVIFTPSVAPYTTW